MVIRISDKTQNYSKVTKLLVKPINKKKYKLFLLIIISNYNTHIILNIMLKQYKRAELLRLFQVYVRKHIPQLMIILYTNNNNIQVIYK